MPNLPAPTPPRLVPNLPLPPYAYVPGRSPHPTSDPQGHHFGVPPERPDPPDPEHWRACRPYLFGIDLFNHGYYWEAHEVWEGLWHACGRKGPTASFLKGLIKLAAAGVKAREGVPQGVRDHARRAAELFRQVEQGPAVGSLRNMGLDLRDLIGLALKTANQSSQSQITHGSRAEIVFGFVLLPAE
jgi:predicted metal-dependent hydrolase